MSTREDLQQTSEQATEKTASKLSAEASTLTFRIDGLIKAAAEKGRTNVVVHRYCGSLATDSGLTREVIAWCTEQYPDLTIKKTSLGHEWVMAHYSEVFGIIVDWSKSGEEQAPYVPPYCQIYY